MTTTASTLTVRVTGLQGEEMTPTPADVLRFERNIAQIDFHGFGIVVVGYPDGKPLRALLFSYPGTFSGAGTGKPLTATEEDGEVRVRIIQSASHPDEPRLDLWVRGLAPLDRED